MFLTKFFPKNRVIFWKSVNSCMFLTLSVWVRNIQEFTDNLVTLQLGQFETKSIPVHFCKILAFAETYRNSLLFNFSTIFKISEFLYVSWLYTEGKKNTGTRWFCENQWIPVWLLHIKCKPTILIDMTTAVYDKKKSSVPGLFTHYCNSTILLKSLNSIFIRQKKKKAIAS